MYSRQAEDQPAMRIRPKMSPNFVKRSDFVPSLSKSKGRKRKSSTRTIHVGVRPVERETSNARGVLVGAAVVVGLLALGMSGANDPAPAPYAMPDTTVSSTTSAQVVSSDIYSAPETSEPVPAPTGECDQYMPAKYRVCPTAVDSSRYPLTIAAPKAAKSSRSASPRSTASTTTTTSVRKSVSATGAKSTTTTKSVKVSK